jgi:hypothetical protein
MILNELKRSELAVPRGLEMFARRKLYGVALNPVSEILSSLSFCVLHCRAASNLLVEHWHVLFKKSSQLCLSK